MNLKLVVSGILATAAAAGCLTGVVIGGAFDGRDGAAVASPSRPAPAPARAHRPARHRTVTAPSASTEPTGYVGTSGRRRTEHAGPPVSHPDPGNRPGAAGDDHGHVSGHGWGGGHDGGGGHGGGRHQSG